MARPSSRSYYGAGGPGDDYADLQHLQHQYNAHQQQQQQQQHQLQQSQYASMHDSHVGINMGALDAQQAHYGAALPGSSSGAGQGQMLGSPMSGTGGGGGNQGSHSAFTSPRQSYGDLSAQHNAIPGGYAGRPGSSSAHGPGPYDAIGNGSLSGPGGMGLGRSASISSGHHSTTHSAHHNSPLQAQTSRLSGGGSALASPVHSMSLHHQQQQQQQQQQQGAYGSPIPQSHPGQGYSASSASYQQQLQQQQQQMQQQHQQARRSREYSRSSEHGFPGGSNSAFHNQGLSGRQSHSALLPTANAGAKAAGQDGSARGGAYSPNSSSIFGTPASASRSPSGGSQNRGSQRPLSYAPPPPGPPSSAGGSGFQTAPNSRMSIHGTEHVSMGGAAGQPAGSNSAYLDMGDGLMRGSSHASPAGPSSSLSRSARDLGGSASELPLHNPHYDSNASTLSSLSSRNIAGLGGLAGAGAVDMLPYAYSSRKGSNASSGLPLYAHSGHHAYPGSSSANSGLPLSASSSSLSTAGYAYGSAIAGPPPAATRPPPQEGFRRVRELSDLKPDTEKASVGKGRRADPAGDFVSPLKALTSYLHHTYHLVNPSFFYELSFNPRRVLTNPSDPVHNDGHDNIDSDYILYVNDWLGTEEGNKYLILDTLGQGTFGQVVKCQNMRTHEIVAVKVIKNKPAYFNQSWMEVTILEMLNTNWDPKDEHHILRLHDTFIHAKHLCLVFELLSSNLYELIRQNSFRGLSTSLVRVFTAQLLDALTVLNEARIIHCDLKPENILLKTLQTPSIKLVDFGSACHEKQTVYTYIQSRFYRSPEVLLGLPYNSAIDMWSLGCIAAELFLGLPPFPGTSEFNQVTRIVEMMGLPPKHMLDAGKQTPEFFNIYTDEIGRKSYRLKSLDQWRKEHPNQDPPEQPSKKYFQATTLPEIIRTYPMSRKSGKPADQQKETANRASFIDFISGLLIMDPAERWTPQQAKLHPFITGDKLTQPFKPPPKHTFSTSSSQRNSRVITSGQQQSAVSLPNNSQYANMPASPGRPNEQQRYQDAAQYNQHIAQQQAYHQATAQRRQAQQALSNSVYGADSANAAAIAAQQDPSAAHALQAQQAAAAHQAAQQQAAAATNPYAPMTNVPSPPQSGGYARHRSDTISRIDPATAAMSLGGAGTLASMNPAMKRDDWSSQPNGGILQSHNQHLQGGGMDASQQGWMGQNPNSPSSYSSGQLGGMGSYPGSPLSGSGHGHSGGGAGAGSGFSVIVDGHDRRIHSSSGGGGSAGVEGLSLGSAGGAIAPPPHAYSPAGGSSAGPRYSMQQPGQPGGARMHPSSGSIGTYDRHYDPTGAAHAAGVPPALLPNMQVKQYADDPQGQYGSGAGNADGGHLPTYHAHGGRY